VCSSVAVDAAAAYEIQGMHSEPTVFGFSAIATTFFKEFQPSRPPLKNSARTTTFLTNFSQSESDHFFREFRPAAALPLFKE
jgi:hypothetical protein